MLKKRKTGGTVRADEESRCATGQPVASALVASISQRPLDERPSEADHQTEKDEADEELEDEDYAPADRARHLALSDGVVSTLSVT